MRRSLQTLQRQTLSRDRFEVVVVANACTDDSVRVANEFAAAGLNVQVVEEPRLGLHHARHAGARAASGAVLAYTDDDCLCAPQWLEALLQAFENENVGCAGGPIKPRFEDCMPPVWFNRFPGILGALDHGDHTRELRYPEDLYGGNFAIRRDLLFSLGGFDPDAFGSEWSGAGETALLRKVYRAGKKVLYVADAVVEHVIPAARRSRSASAAGISSRGKGQVRLPLFT